MQKVLIFDVAASTRGALTVLRSFYETALNRTDINWVFVLSDAYISEDAHIKIVRAPEAKRGWISRLWFDYIKAPNLVKEEKPDAILSLQNITIPFCKERKITFLHQSIPFSDYRFSFSHNRLEWIYQNVISRFIYSSLRKSDIIAVQTEWIRKAVHNKLGIPNNRIVVIPPTINIGEYKPYHDTLESRKVFIYPSAYATYKNHRVIVDAVNILKQRGIEDFKVYFTIEKNEMPDISSELSSIEVIGTIPFEQLIRYYSESVLLFPSLLETFGLPLAEAGIVGSRILAADRPFSREILEDYTNARFFDPSDAEQLANLMENTIVGTIKYEDNASKVIKERYSKNNWEALIQLL